MLLNPHKSPASVVYIEIRDRARKRKSECLTVEGATPKQMLHHLAQFLRRQQRRKAG